jgi:hypothetical protein
VILYEMFAGSNPFEAENPIAICMKHIQHVPPQLIDVRPDLKPEISTLVQRLLEKEPDDRYQSASELREDLSNLSSGTEIRGARVQAAVAVPEHLLKLGPLYGVLNQVPGVEASRPLTPAETKLLTLIDGTTTIKQVLSTCGLPEVEASEAILSLQTEGIVYSEIPLGGMTEVGGTTTRVPGARTTSRNASAIPTAPTERKIDTAVPGTVVTPAKIPPAKKGIPAWVFAAVGVVVVGIIVAAVLLLKAPATLTAVTVDASPFATVTVTSQQGQKVLTDETPFTVSLAPGSYTFEFVSAGQEPKKVTKQIAAAATDAVRVEFWTTEETRKLLENYIQ